MRLAEHAPAAAAPCIAVLCYGNSTALNTYAQLRCTTPVAKRESACARSARPTVWCGGLLASRCGRAPAPGRLEHWVWLRWPPHESRPVRRPPAQPRFPGARALGRIPGLCRVCGALGPRPSSGTSPLHPASRATAALGATAWATAPQPNLSRPSRRSRRPQVQAVRLTWNSCKFTVASLL